MTMSTHDVDAHSDDVRLIELVDQLARAEGTTRVDVVDRLERPEVVGPEDDSRWVTARELLASARRQGRPVDLRAAATALDENEAA